MSDRPDESGRARLERAPGERYRAGGPGDPGRPGGGRPTPRGRMAPGTKAILTAVVLGDAVGIAFAAVAQLSLGPGLVALGAFAGWLTAIALIWWGRDAVPRPTRAWLAPLLGAWPVLFGLLLDWLLSRVQGGVLGPLDYALQVHGVVGPLALVMAVLLAAWRAR